MPTVAKSVPFLNATELVTSSVPVIPTLPANVLVPVPCTVKFEVTPNKVSVLFVANCCAFVRYIDASIA